MVDSDEALIRHEERYRDALHRHFREPSEQGLRDAYELGRRALAEGISILDFVTIHMDARRVLFPSVGAQFTDVDAFLRSSLGAFSQVQRELDDTRLIAEAEHTRIRTLRFSEQLDLISAELGGVSDLQSVLDRFIGSGCDVIGCIACRVWLFGGEGLEMAADRNGEGISGRLTVEDLSTVATTGAPVFERGRRATVPLRLDGEPIGAVDLEFASTQPFDDAQRACLRAVGDRLATAIDRSRSFERNRLARLDAESSTARFRALRDIAAELAQATTRRAVAAVLLRGVMSASAATVGAVAMLRPRGRRPDLLVTFPPGDSRRARALGTAARAIDPATEFGVPVELESSNAIRQLIGDNATDDLGAEALIAYRIQSRRRVTGLLIVGWSDARVLDELDHDLITAQIVMGAPALERAARYDIEHDIASTLQRGMLTIPDADFPELSWSAHYSTPTSGLAGGDWYDVIDLSDDRVGFVIGDIVGRGIDAAVAMGHLRSASRALATCFDKPDEVLGAVDRFAATTGTGHYSSMAYATLNRRAGELHYGVAGHPPPLVLMPDGEAVWLDGARSTLLGLGGSRSAASLTIPPGTVLVLYTDGLVERRREPLDMGLQRLVAAVREEASDEDARNDARRLVARMATSRHIDDDVAVIYVNYRGPA